jgi:hypothetical protein
MSEEKEGSTANISHEDKAQLLMRGAIHHLRIALEDRVKRSEKITGALRDDSQAWELESVIAEIRKYTVLVKLVEAIIDFMG